KIPQAAGDAEFLALGQRVGVNAELRTPRAGRSFGADELDGDARLALQEAAGDLFAGDAEGRLVPGEGGVGDVLADAVRQLAPGAHAFDLREVRQDVGDL